MFFISVFSFAILLTSAYVFRHLVSRQHVRTNFCSSADLHASCTCHNGDSYNWRMTTVACTAYDNANYKVRETHYYCILLNMC